jgi:hypothetical protein
LTTVEPDEQGKTARIEPQPPPAPPSASAPSPAVAPGPSDSVEASPAPTPTHIEEEPAQATTTLGAQPASVVARPQQEVVFVPLAVNVGDGFKFGCGFFLAFVLAMLVGFVLLAGLFVLSSLFGLNLPITR